MCGACVLDSYSSISNGFVSCEGLNKETSLEL